MVFFGPEAYVPIVNEEEVEGRSRLNARGARWLFQVVGHLKAGVTPAQAVADLNAIGADLEKTYPTDDGQMTFALARPGLYGDYLGPAVRGFLVGLTLLAGLILLAACANLGSLFAARAADRSREVALRLALGASRSRIVRQLLTEAVLIALIGGAAGVAGSLVILRGLSAWQPFTRFPIMHVVVVTPDATVSASRCSPAWRADWCSAPCQSGRRCARTHADRQAARPASARVDFHSRSAAGRPNRDLRRAGDGVQSPCAGSTARCTAISASNRTT